MSASATQSRVFNFSAGPATMPAAVLESIRDELLCYPGVGASVMEISHRSATFVSIIEEAKSTLRDLMQIPDDYELLFLQGGSALQFSMVPANLLRGSGKTAHYFVSGSWSKKAIKEAKKEGKVECVFDGSETNFNTLPTPSEYQIPDDSALAYYCSNETIQGVQFKSEPTAPSSVPIACDASSDFLSQPVDISKYGLYYACAQKNAGPAGVTVVVVRKDLLERSSDDLPGYLNYKNHAGADSMWNTPPTFAIYALGKVAKWLQDGMGGLDAMAKLNEEKANLLYAALDAAPHVFIGHAQKEYRSTMNVTFRFADESLQNAFIEGASQQQLDALKGHRSVGGIRASIYNAMPRDGVVALAQFMNDFAAKHG